MRLLWLCVGVAVIAAVATGQGNLKVSQAKGLKGGGSKGKGQGGGGGSKGKGQGGGGGSKGCADKLPQKVCTDMSAKGKCSFSVLSNMCGKTCNSCDCADKKSAKFCSKVRTQKNCKNWGLSKNCKWSCDLCGRSAPRNDTQYHCEVSGDPHSQNFNGQGASVPFPCFYRVADLLININRTTAFSFLRIEVQASSNSLYEGRFFVGTVKVSMTIYNGTVDNLVKAYSRVFTTDESRINDNRDNPNGRAWHQDGDLPTWDWAEAGYDSKSSQAFLLVYYGSPTILYRPVNRKEKFPQTLLPGLFIDVGDDVIKHNTVQFPYSLCSNTDDARDVTELASNLNFTKREFLLHSVLSQRAPQTIGYCKNALHTYQTCRERHDLLYQSALKKCQPFLNRFAIRCLAPHAPHVFAAFHFCLQYNCELTSFGVARFVARWKKGMDPQCQAQTPDIMPL